MPADLTFPSDIASVRCSLTISRPGRISGRSSDLGIRIASYNQPYNLNRGQAYWSGELEIAPTDKSSEVQRGIIEATIADYLQGNRSIHIPVSRSTLVTFNTPPPANENMITLNRNRMTYQTGGVTDITFRKGTYFTINDKLYMFIGNDKNVKVASIVAADTFPRYPAAQNASQSVEYENPYLLGILPVDTSILLDREGSFAGPWIIPFVSE